MARVIRRRRHPESATEKLAEDMPKVFWPDTRGTEPFLTITVGDIVLYLEGMSELKELYMGFFPYPDDRYLDL